MKFLVLALCVCAASAASFGGNKPYKSFARPAVAPVAYGAQAVVSTGAEVFAPVAVPVAKAAAQAYQPAQQVVTKNVPYSKEAEAVVLRSESEISPVGYNYVYETSNGIEGQSVGTLKKVGDEEVLVSQGSYRYVSDDGTPVVFTYVADENGYQPSSELLPVGPPVPEAIARAIAYTASLRAAEPSRVQY